jgi:ribosomal protein S18 acetylase RimI-like enzyme
MITTASIRYATLDDINTIGFLAQQIWPAAYGGILAQDKIEYMLNLMYSPSSLAKQMIDQKHSFLVMEEEEEPVGFASFSPLPGNKKYKLHKLYVLPDRQGKGMGKAMVDFIAEEISPMGAVALEVNVYRENKAVEFYQRLGFTVTGETDLDIGNGFFMNDYVMEKKLE